jgi:hypothetical protein
VRAILAAQGSAFRGVLCVGGNDNR